MQRAIHGKAVLSIVGSILSALAPRACAFRGRALASASHQRYAAHILSRVGTAVVALCCAPLSANAQTLSGGITVQMQVGSRATANSPGNNGGAQTLGASPFFCTASANPVDFGRVVLNPDGTLPTISPARPGSVVVTCSPPQNPNPTGSVSAGIVVGGGHGGGGPPFLMTLNDANSSLGIFYRLFDNSGVGGREIKTGAIVAQTVVLNPGISDTTIVNLFGRISNVSGLNTNYTNGSPPSGVYLDTLSISLVF